MAPGGHSAGAAAQDEGKALEQANALSLHFFADHKFRVSIENFILNASLAVLWHYPSAARISALQQEYRYLSQAVTLRAHEDALLQALMLSLDYRFDEALLLLAKHPPESARDNHLNQLLGFAVSQFCGLPHHAQRYLSQLSQYQARVAPAPLVQQLFKQVIGDFMKQLERRELRLTYLRQERQRASAAGQHQLAVQYALTLQEEFPALPGDAWQLLELLQLCWPVGMAAPGWPCWWIGWSGASTTAPPSWSTTPRSTTRPCCRSAPTSIPAYPPRPQLGPVSRAAVTAARVPGCRRSAAAPPAASTRAGSRVAAATDRRAARTHPVASPAAGSAPDRTAASSGWR